MVAATDRFGRWPVNALRRAVLAHCSRFEPAGFDRVQPYAPGDDARRIDWSASARSGDLLMRTAAPERSLIFAAALDDSSSMQVGRFRPLLRAANEAIAAWYGAAQGEDRCARVRDGCVQWRASSESSGGAFNLEQHVATARSKLARGSVVLVVTDIFGGNCPESLLQDAARRLYCTVLLAEDPWHGELPLRGFVNVRDAESKALRELFFGGRERRAYARAVAQRQRRVREMFVRCGWRLGVLDECSGAAALYRAFGLEAPAWA